MVEAERQQMYGYRKGKANHESGDDIHGFQVRRGRVSVPLPVWDEGRNIGARAADRNRLVPCPADAGSTSSSAAVADSLLSRRWSWPSSRRSRKVQMSTGGEGNPEQARKDVQRQ
jgi:hypothetical protein